MIMLLLDSLKSKWGGGRGVVVRQELIVNKSSTAYWRIL